MELGASIETLKEFEDMFNAFIMENIEFRIVGYINIMEFLGFIIAKNIIFF